MSVQAKASPPPPLLPSMIAVMRPPAQYLGPLAKTSLPKSLLWHDGARRPFYMTKTAFLVGSRRARICRKRELAAT